VSAQADTRVAVSVHGRVQGVGYRYYTREIALELGLVGWVRNCADGSVEAELQGSGAQVCLAVERLRQGPRHGRVERILESSMPVDPGDAGFVIRH